MAEGCVYPGCQELPSPDASRARAAFCAIHASAKCKFAEIGQCDSLVQPRSGWCKLHNDEVVRFDFIHAIRHQEALRLLIEQQQVQAAMKKIAGGGGDGRLIVPGR